MKKLAANCSVAISGLIVSLLVVELSLRFLGFSDAKYVISPSTRGGVGRTFNKYSMYERGFNSFVKPAGVKRLLWLGDSMTAGLSYPYEEGVVKQAQRRLNRRLDDSIECVNMAVPGNGPVHYYNHLSNLGLMFEPDVVVVNVYLGNDLRDASQALRTRDLESSWLKEAVHDFTPCLYNLSRYLIRNYEREKAFLTEQGILNWYRSGKLASQGALENYFVTIQGFNRDTVRSRFSRMDPSLLEDFIHGKVTYGAETLFGSLRDPLYPLRNLDTTDAVIRTGLLTLESFLSKIDSLTSSNYHKLVICLIPVDNPQQTKLGYDINLIRPLSHALTEHILRYAGAHGLTVYDLHEALVDAPESAKYYDWDGHLSRLGQSRMAEAIADSIIDSRILN